MTPQNPNESKRVIGAHERRVSVTLTCGCAVKARNAPINTKTTYPCPSNAGHGYQVRWQGWTDGGRSNTNADLT